MNTNMTGIRWLSEIFAFMHPCALDVSSLILALEGLSPSYMHNATSINIYALL